MFVSFDNYCVWRLCFQIGFGQGSENRTSKRKPRVHRAG